MAHGGSPARTGATKTRRSVGAYGSTRGKERQRRRAENRARDPRYAQAMEETRQHQEALNALIEEQKQNPAVGEVEGAMHAARLREKEAALAAAQKAEEEARRAAAETPEEKPAKKAAAKKTAAKKAAPKPPEPQGYDTSKLKQESADETPFALTSAKMMLKNGYHIKYVIESTGIGYEELKDIEIDDDGYGVTEEQKCSVCGMGIKTS